MPDKVLIVGASGVVGTAAFEAFLREGWGVVALSRGKPEVAQSRPFLYLAADLFDGKASREALSVLTDVTYVVFAALSEKPSLVEGWSDPDQMEVNLGADFCFAYGATESPPPAFVSAIKLRQAGFTEVSDTEDMFRYWLQNFIDRGIFPRH